jgi:hypothetical protein
MATGPRFRLFSSDTGGSVTADFGQLPGEYYGYGAKLPQSIFTTSSTTGYRGLTANFDSESYNIQDNLLSRGVTIYNRMAEGQITLPQVNMLASIVNDLTREFELVEVHFSSKCMIVTCGAYSENRSNNTDSNIQETNYDEAVSGETSSKIRELIYLLNIEAIEDGYFHPAEKLIEDSLKSSKFDPNHWVYAAYFKHIDTEPTLAAGVLRLLGRFPRGQVGEWGMVIAINGLSHRDIEVREAAVRALERWGGHEALDALKTCVDAEPIPWLATYIRQVIIDLED